MFWFRLLFSIFAILCCEAASANSTSTNAVYDGTWHGTDTGMPAPDQTNIFNATTGHPALTVIDNSTAYLDQSTNRFNGSLVIESASTIDLTTSVNTITDGITLAYNAFADLSKSTNTITGGVIVNGGFIYFSSVGSNNATTILDTLTVNDDSVVDFSNTGSGSVTNTITSLAMAGNRATLDLSNSGNGSSNNTLDTVSLSNGILRLGGSGSTNPITTQNWSGGELDAVYAYSGFGTTNIQNLNITAPVILNFNDANSGNPLTPGSLSGAVTELTVNSFTGDASQLLTTSGFTEVMSTDYPSGITLSNDGYMYVNLIPLPTIASVSPSAGPIAGGTSVTITGTNFTGATAVKFGDTNATSFTLGSATSITATSPPGTAGSVTLSVTTPGGTVTGSGFTYTSAATVPDAPTAVNALGGNNAATINWTPPSFDGGSAITSYTATSFPGGFSCTTSATSCLIGGLTNNTSYTFTAQATNALGTGSASSESNSVTPIKDDAFFNIAATGTAIPQTSIQLCLNVNGSHGVSCQNYEVSASDLSLLTTIANHVYPAAGIKTVSGYGLSGCTLLNNGYCAFSISNTQAASITLTSNALTRSVAAGRGTISVDASAINLIQGGATRAITVKNTGATEVNGIGVSIKAPIVDISVVKNSCPASLASGASCKIIFQAGNALGKTKAAITSTNIASPVFLAMAVIAKN